MCTAVTYSTSDHYFGRNLDVEFSHKETVTITPRNFSLKFRHQPDFSEHFAMIGIAFVNSGYPLYYDAVNEKGLAMAGLRFTDGLEYKELSSSCKNLAPFEFIPWILGKCSSVDEACGILKDVNIAKIDFSSELPASPLHWMIADKSRSVVVECTASGMTVTDNPVGVLTNNPVFKRQLFNLNNYMTLSAKPPKNLFSEALDLKPYSRGMGAMGLPGDMSSMSRFVRAAFIRHNSISGSSETESISQFFHILNSVAQYRGCVILPDGSFEITRYSSCMNLDKGIYYYTTYENSSITAVDMTHEDLDGNELISYPLITAQQIRRLN